MENSKEYNEALERAKQILCNLPDCDPRIADIQTIFPELADSDDEKIRKRLLKLFKEHHSEEWYGLNVNEVIFWLKKQEEEERQWSEKDDTILNNIIWAVHMKSIKPIDEMDSRQKYVDYEEWLRKFKFKHKKRWNQNEWDMFRSIYTDVRNARQITVNSLDGDVKKQEEKRMEEVLDFLKSFCPKEECAEDF